MLSTEQIDSFYKDKLKEFGAGSQGVGWKNDHAQIIRFEQLVKIINTESFSLNDLGCGTGDLYGYAKKKFPGMIKYYGYDMLQDMIDLAEKNNSKSEEIVFSKINTLADLKVADYTIASGIFNPRFDIGDELWKAHILQTLDAMNKNSSKGFSFNALTSYSDSHLMKPELFYSDPLWLFHHCKTHYSKEVALLHDYGIYDFTILVRKS